MTPTTHDSSAELMRDDLMADITGPGNLRGVYPYVWGSFDDFGQESLDNAVRKPFQEREPSTTFSVSLVNGPIDRVIVRFLENCVEYIVPAHFYNAERRDFFTNRWLGTRPLFAAVKECYPSLRGECQLWLDDIPSGPGLAFCGNAPSQICIPDSAFIESVGYARSRVEFAGHMKAWASRFPKVFWRGGTSGFPNDPWQAIPRVDLCFKAREINRDDLFDVAISHIGQIYDARAVQQIIDSGLMKAWCPQITFVDYKYAIDIDGNSCSWPGLFMKFLLQNTVIKVDSLRGWRQWYYDQLIPWRNFVPLSSSMTELYDIAEWLREHDDEAAQIALQGRRLAETLTFDQVVADTVPIIRDHVETAKHLSVTEPQELALVRLQHRAFGLVENDTASEVPTIVAPEPLITQMPTITDTRDPLVANVKEAFSQCLAGNGSLPKEILSMDGMSGRKYRLFINNLIRNLPDARYLEIGSWAGSTLCSAINGNTVSATAVDNWSEFGGPKQDFIENLEKFKTPHASVNFLEKDFREVDFSSLGKFDIYMFDGPHGEHDQYDGIMRAEAALEEKFVLIVDDWNWEQVRNGTLRAIADLKVSLLLGLDIRTTLDNSHPDISGPTSDWHNGYYIAVLERASPSSNPALRL